MGWCWLPFIDSRRLIAHVNLLLIESKQRSGGWRRQTHIARSVRETAIQREVLGPVTQRRLWDAECRRQRFLEHEDDAPVAGPSTAPRSVTIEERVGTSADPHLLVEIESDGDETEVERVLPMRPPEASLEYVTPPVYEAPRVVTPPAEDAWREGEPGEGEEPDRDLYV